MKRTNREARWKAGPTLEALESRDLPSSGSLTPGPQPIRSHRKPLVQSPSTRREIGTDRFFAAFAGPYVAGRNDAVDPGRTLFIRGGGNSSAFLHGDVLMSIEIPPGPDPSGAPTGKASLFVKNYAVTSNLLILDLVGDPQDGRARDGRPTRLTWSVGEGSSGAFTGAEGQGSLEIVYQPGGKLPPHAIDAGRAGVKFSGRVRIEKTANPLRVK